MRWKSYKLIAIVLLVSNILFSLPAYAKSDNSNLLYDFEDIEKITVNPINIGGYVPYDYTTTDSKEIEYISYILNSFDAHTLETSSFLLYGKYYSISLYNKNNEISHITITIYDIAPNEAYIDYVGENLHYKIKREELDTFLSFIHGLRENEINLSDYNAPDYSFTWKYPEIETAIEKGIFPAIHRLGYSEKISRLEVCQLVLNLIKLNRNDEHPDDIEIMKNPFLDSIYLFGVKEIYALGIIEGKSKNKFFPYDNITREEFAKILSKTYHVINCDPKEVSGKNTYIDSSEIADWAEEYVDEMTALGVFQGSDSGYFDPKSEITKEEVVITLLRLSESITQGK